MPSDTHNAAQHRRQASSFGAAAAAYEHGRPPYPPEAVDWLLPEGASRVLDLGAGTGKLTRQLRDRGLDVIAVEPSEGMREQLARVVPGAAVAIRWENVVGCPWLSCFNTAKAWASDTLSLLRSNVKY